ncbi:MAG TPA: SAM-dependent methyltransferase [Bacteroidales bacterium]|nr:SAM-dependent methyltransferase [Bacteroidales bacterium]HOR60581.1 SAM-dependent methyltransferase [Bacteroidales bacterium]HPL03865.1 SAM-dependent methyltransferase [Bacteroidales bacterium]
MKIFEANISLQVCEFLKDFFNNTSSFEIANQKILDFFGINDFFENDNDFKELKKSVSIVSINSVAEPDRAEYGDFQTNKDLANKLAKRLSKNNILPEIIIEPTCGKGNFIIASLSNFKTVKKVFGIEIYKPYIWETKFSILDYFLSNPNNNKPEITIKHCNIFDFDFKNISKQYPNEKLLIIGNPPWVTNSKLGSLNSSNLPKKSNFKNQNGLDAMTGKGNFDIAEYITLMLLDVFQTHNGHLALLVKNSVIKNIIFDQKDAKYKIGKIEKYCIDSKKEFNVSVEASLFYCQLNSTPSFQCNELDFYSLEKNSSFGWLNTKFVSNLANYNETKEIDGQCPFEWRQGIKHDCSNVMELERENECFINKLSQKIKLEEDLIYGFLKSSDLKNTVIQNTRKQVIITQTKVGQDTSYIQHLYPKTYNYLKSNITFFQARKSSIYKGKPHFSIFGIGDYSFKPYKVAISGLYKTYHFTLVLPQDNKPIMLDDTCYFIGFDKIEFAVYTLILLNHSKTEEFLKSITFPDAKRVFTKDILMRLDLLNIAKTISQKEIEEQINFLNNKYDININLLHWNSFINTITPKKAKQLTIF